MGINRIMLKNVLVFKHKFEMDFCSGVNLLIGGNGIGKTTILKVLYMMNDATKHERQLPTVEEYNNKKTDFECGKNGLDKSLYFPYHYYGSGIRHAYSSNYNRMSDDVSLYETFEGGAFEGKYEVITAYGLLQSYDMTFIPNNDMLSHAEGFLALYSEYKLPFDKMRRDIIAKAELPVTRKVSSGAEILLEKIKNIIGGEVTHERGVFYIDKSDGERVPFSIEASAFQKFGLLWKLIRNGLLKKDSILLWDEPENSLNPEFVPVLVDIMLELSRNGVQIFIATHSEILSSYFDVSRKDGDEVMFASLYREGDFVKVNTGDRFNWLEPNSLTEAPVKLYEKKLDKGLGGNG